MKENYKHCRRCGRKVKHPIALTFGVGRVCAKKTYMIPNPYLQECPDDQKFTYSQAFRSMEEPVVKPENDRFWGTK